MAGKMVVLLRLTSFITLERNGFKFGNEETKNTGSPGFSFLCPNSTNFDVSLFPLLLNTLWGY